MLDLNVTIYYPANSTTWNISNFDPVGAKDIIFVPWNPIEEGPEETEESDGTQEKETEGTGKKDKGFFEEHKTLLFIIIAIVIVLIICIIIIVFIKKRRAKTSDGIESIKGELISENMN